MKVTFVYPDQLPADPGWQGHYYCGLGVLSAVLKRAGHETSLIHLTQPEVRDEAFLARLGDEQPGLLAFSCTTFAFTLAARLAQLAKRVRPELVTVCGGLHPTLAPEEVIDTPGFDVLCRGEGEQALLELVQRIEAGHDYKSVQNLWVREGDQVHRNPLRPLIQDLDSLPFADRDLFDYPKLCWERRGWATVMMSRGCGYSCAYCANHALRKLYGSKGYVRFRSVDNVMAELEKILNRHDFIHNVLFDDDLPFIHQAYVEEFCEKYKKRVGVPFRFNLRPNVAFEDRLRMLRDAGAAEAKIGLESGNEDIINNVLKRGLTLAQIEEAFHACRRAGLDTQSFNMVGLPGETPQAILDRRGRACRPRALHGHAQGCRGRGLHAALPRRAPAAFLRLVSHGFGHAAQWVYSICAARQGQGRAEALRGAFPVLRPALERARRGLDRGRVHHRAA